MYAVLLGRLLPSSPRESHQANVLFVQGTILVGGIGWGRRDESWAPVSLPFPRVPKVTLNNSPRPQKTLLHVTLLHCDQEKNLGFWSQKTYFITVFHYLLNLYLCIMYCDPDTVQSIL